jgi:hypothetical protein
VYHQGLYLTSSEPVPLLREFKSKTFPTVVGILYSLNIKNKKGSISGTLVTPSGLFHDPLRIGLTQNPFFSYC